MKQILLIPILLISTLFFSFAQPISTFAPVGAEWWYQAHQFTPDVFKESKSHQYISLEEVEHKGKLCRRIEVIEHFVDSTGAAHKTKLPDEYVYNNEDTVFYYSDKYKRFVPLYIFNVKVGDTLSFYVPEKLEMYVGDTIFKLIVDSIYQMELNEIPLQNIVLRQIKCARDTTYPPFEANNLAFGKFASQPCLWGGEYTEKLGCIQSGFISLSKRNIRPSVGVHKDPQILCYSDSSLSVVFNYDESVPVNEECLYPGKLSIDNLSHLGKNLAVYPNPAKEYIQLKLPDGIATPHEIKVLDFTGKVVQTIIASGNNQFSVQNLPQGIYTVAAPVEDNWYYVKMIKL